MIRYLLVYVSSDMPGCTLISHFSSTTPRHTPLSMIYGLNFEYDDDLTSLSTPDIRSVIFNKGRQMMGTLNSSGIVEAIPEEKLPQLFDHCRQEIYHR